MVTQNLINQLGGKREVNLCLYVFVISPKDETMYSLLNKLSLSQKSTLKLVGLLFPSIEMPSCEVRTQFFP